MGFLDDLLGLVQKPQSIATGATEGFLNQIQGKESAGARKQRGLNRILEDLESKGIDTGSFSALRHQYDDTSNIFSGAMAGLKGHMSPADMVNRVAGGEPGANRDSFAERVMSTAVDAGADPLLALGPAAKAGSLGRLGSAAATPGSLGKGASLAERAAQTGRQLYQGQLVAPGLEGLGVGLGLKAGETGVQHLAPAISRRLYKSGVKGMGANVDEGQLFDPSQYNVSRADATDIGAATPGPASFEDVPLGRSTEGMLREAIPQSPALPPASAPSFEAGPVGSTGQLNPQLEELLQMSGRNHQLPPAFGTSGGFPMPAATPRSPMDELLEILLAEKARLGR